jgi:DNA-binding protein WhiA
MSYSGKVKEELAKQFVPARHCQLSELAAIFRNCGEIYKNAEGKISLGFRTENPTVAKKFFTLLKKVYTIEINVKEQSMGKKYIEYPIIENQQKINAILKSLHFMNEEGSITEDIEYISPLLLKKSCCKRAFLRGSFFSSGSMSDPIKGYHLEFVCISEPGAIQIQEILLDFDIEAKIVARKKYFVVYIKEGEAIVNLLNVMEAHVSLMDFENRRIVRGVRNQVNRRVNCEAANITKTVTASARQREDIIFIREHGGLEQLPRTLREIASARLEYPDLSLKELGELVNPSIGKSGVNHRFRKINEIANKERLDR